MPIKGIGPDVEAVTGADQLGGDADPVAAHADRTLQHVGHAELGGDLGDRPA